MGEVIFDPLLPQVMLWVVIAFAVLSVVLALWRGLSGWGLRALAAVALIIAIANPSLQNEDRAPLSDIVIAVVDESASQRIAGRPEQTQAALEALTREVAALPNTELRVVRLGDAPGDGGTLLMSALSEALSEEPADRVAGMVLLTDGRLHDLDQAPALKAPLHVLLSGKSTDWDRRLTIKNAPAFAILGEPVTLTLRVDDDGAVPLGQSGFSDLAIAVDGGEPQVFQVPVGRDVELPISLAHGGTNVIQFNIPASPGELTDRNNAAVVQMNGVRDRLRVLLVSGEPHAGERTWRNLLKSDSSVDLVHFTILRPPEKQDGVPVSELSLIAFPTRELFLEKIDEFDLIVFDRYKLRGILPSLYLDNIRRYVENGGAVLVAAGPDFASAASLYRSPLGEILPGAPTSRVIEEGFTPQISELGERHPVTEGLKAYSPNPDATDGPGWGRWMRQVEIEPVSGETVMEGLEGRPLLQLDRVGEGRVALLASDQAWLWSRGFEGGGPQLELLRRLAHWMMKEPDLEEEALRATATGQSMTITRQTLKDKAGDVTITGPDGAIVTVPLEQIDPGRWTATYDPPQIGLYRLSDGSQETVVALGPSAPREFERTIADAGQLDPLIDQTRGGALRLEDGVPDVRLVRAGRQAAGRGWIGITPRNAYLTRDVTVTPFLPAWLFLLIAALLTIAAWLYEGRKT